MSLDASWGFQRGSHLQGCSLWLCRQDMPWELLTKGSIADHFLWASGEEIRVTQMVKVCKPEMDTNSGTCAAVLMLWVLASVHLSLYGRDRYE